MKQHVGEYMKIHEDQDYRQGCIMNTGAGAGADTNIMKFGSKEIRYRHKIILGLFSRLGKKKFKYRSRLNKKLEFKNT